jgi:perosamine synthetase
MSDVADRYGRMLDAVRAKFPGDGVVPLHAPVFLGREKQYLAECIDSTFVSSVGPFVDRFEEMMAEIAGTRFAVATMNGTAALHMALILAGVGEGDEVITQPLTFVATCNAIAYQRAHPVFVDVDRDTLGLSPDSLEAFLADRCERRGDVCVNRVTGRRVAAVLPMHTFGLSARITRIAEICERWGLPLVEDAAEALGSTQDGRPLGSFGRIGAFSFNGNKIVTSGGGGAIVTDDPVLARRGKHLTTTAKVPHAWNFHHDEVGYNYRLPNINAALACAQLEQLPLFLQRKRALAAYYAEVARSGNLQMVREPTGCRSNYWLNALVVDEPGHRDRLLEEANGRGIMMRPIWALMTDLPAFASAQRADGLTNATWLQQRVVNLPSSVTTA